MSIIEILNYIVKNKLIRYNVYDIEVPSLYEYCFYYNKKQSYGKCDIVNKCVYQKIPNLIKLASEMSNLEISCDKCKYKWKG